MNAPRDPAPIEQHVAGLIYLAFGLNSAAARALPKNERTVAAANIVAAKLTPHLLAFGEMIEAAELQGWDGAADLAPILDKARAAHAALTGFDNTAATP